MARECHDVCPSSSGRASLVGRPRNMQNHARARVLSQTFLSQKESGTTQGMCHQICFIIILLNSARVTCKISVPLHIFYKNTLGSLGLAE